MGKFVHPLGPHTVAVGRNCSIIQLSNVVVFFRHSYFAFEHSPSYQEVQFLFLDAVESLNPNNISVSDILFYEGMTMYICELWIF